MVLINIGRGGGGGGERDPGMQVFMEKLSDLDAKKKK